MVSLGGSESIYGIYSYTSLFCRITEETGGPVRPRAVTGNALPLFYQQPLLTVFFLLCHLCTSSHRHSLRVFRFYKSFVWPDYGRGPLTIAISAISSANGGLCLLYVTTSSGTTTRGLPENQQPLFLTDSIAFCSSWRFSVCWSLSVCHPIFYPSHHYNYLLFGLSKVHYRKNLG